MADISPGRSHLNKGIDYAATFLLSIGPDEAAVLMQKLAPREVQRLAAAMSRPRKISREVLETVMQDFVDRLRHQTSVGGQGDSYLREVLAKALGKDKATEVLDRIVTGGEYAGLEIIKWADAKTIAEMIRFEHPQIVASILAHLEADKAGDVLHNLPDRIIPDIVFRLATMAPVAPNAIRELNEVLDQQLSGQITNTIVQGDSGGPKAAAEVLNRLEPSRMKSSLDYVRGLDAVLAQKIEDNMFTFEDLKELDARSLQLILRDIDRNVLVTAMKNASDILKTQIFANMSERAVEMLREEMASQGPIRLSEVESAQRTVLSVAQKLDQSGQIVLNRGGEDAVIG
ncbi:flagellar motor switch protein FliG [Acidithiobacillus ferriphilus]|uniref:flagellar motor switch protein FliG n=1 Tax=Acidithiobacillus ferriphilus TaxID=1689834 RepID=UPI001C06D1D2|nr:flagellar motor switch protein FliG [Acidithiobacillus ferriphilus]MBU2829281.1 flagellar motor switch protein FliG [Acidithiobacillus ferriphilus]